MNFINRIKQILGINVEYNEFKNQSEALVTEFSEIKNNPLVEDRIEAPIDFIDRATNRGAFHSYSVAQIHFDLGNHGDYPVELALPRFPDEESEIEQFMNRLGYDVQDLPQLEQGNFTVPFVRVEGEWYIDWDEIETMSDEDVENELVYEEEFEVED